jgi:hypothetical protein
MKSITGRLELAAEAIDDGIIHLAGIESDDAAIALAMLKKAGERLALALADIQAEAAREAAEHMREAV